MQKILKKIIRGDIFYADLEPVVGSEQKGYRPVVVIQNNKGNKEGPTTIIAPITKKNYVGKRYPTHVAITQFNEIRPNSIVMLEQIRVIDKTRLKGYITVVNQSDMKKIDKAIKISLELE